MRRKTSTQSATEIRPGTGAHRPTSTRRPGRRANLQFTGINGPIQSTGGATPPRPGHPLISILGNIEDNRRASETGTLRPTAMSVATNVSRAPHHDIAG